MASKKSKKQPPPVFDDAADPLVTGLNSMQTLATSLYGGAAQTFDQNRTVSSFDYIDNPNHGVNDRIDDGDSFQTKSIRGVPQSLESKHYAASGTSSKAQKNQNNGHDEELKTSMRPYGTDSKTRGQTFLINTQGQPSKKRRYDDIEDGRMSAYNRRFVDDEAEESYGEESSAPKKKKVNARELEKHMKSKKQLYSCLCIEGQIYLPPEKECTAVFMQQIMCGQKKYFLMSQIAMVKVPHLPELSAGTIFKTAMCKPRFREYLPDNDYEKPLNRQYVFNIINTIDPDFFQQCIPEAYKQRQEQMALKQNKQVEMLDNFFKLITNSQMIGRDNKRGRVFTGFNKVCVSNGVPLRQTNRKPPTKYSLGGTLGDSSSRTLGHRSKMRKQNEDSLATSTPKNNGCMNNLNQKDSIVGGNRNDTISLQLHHTSQLQMNAQQLKDPSQLKESIMDQTADSTMQPQITSSGQQFVI